VILKPNIIIQKRTDANCGGMLAVLVDSITLGIFLGESCYNWHLYACRLFYLA
jgi:hypothetical protein